MMLVLGLVAGCASTPEEEGASQATAEQAIADAKSTNAQAKKMNAEWRDTEKVIAVGQHVTTVFFYRQMAVALFFLVNPNDKIS